MKTETVKKDEVEVAGITGQPKGDATEIAEADEQEKLIQPEKSSNIIAKADGKILFQFPRSLSRNAEDIKTDIKDEITPAKQLTADVLKVPTEEDASKRESAPKDSSAYDIVIFGGVLGIAIVIFIVWLVCHERKLLAATSRRFQQLDFKPSFDLKSRAKRLFKRNQD